MISATNLLETFHNKLLRAQAVERIINRDDFIKCYEKCNEVERTAVEIIIFNFDLQKLKEWVFKHMDPYEKPVAVLREDAQRLGIRSTSRMSRIQIIRAIERVRDEKI